MDLSLLRDSLPPGNGAQTDRDLLENFKAAALSVTTLYKSSLQSSKRAYNEGYASCLRDVLNFVQAGVSAEGRMAELGGHDGSGSLGLNLNFDVDGDGMTIGRVMDWAESRLETIRSEEEDAADGGSGREEEEERVRARLLQKARATAAAASATKKGSTTILGPLPVAPAAVVRSAAAPPALSSSLTQPTSDRSPPSNTNPQPSSSSPTRTSNPTLSHQSHLPSAASSNGSLTRARSKAERQLRHSLSSGHDISVEAQQPLPTFDGDFDFGQITLPGSTQSLLGSKRRHAAMVSEITNTTPSSTGSPDSPSMARSVVGGSGRRRVRAAPPSATPSRPATLVDMNDTMDIEEMEPARKRVTRR